MSSLASPFAWPDWESETSTLSELESSCAMSSSSSTLVCRIGLSVVIMLGFVQRRRQFQMVISRPSSTL